MYYSDELIEEIRTKSDIANVISGYVKLQKKGANYWGCCPFHNEKTPSFSVSENKQMYHCFGCGVSGNVYTFLMKYENYTFPEAVKELAHRVGVDLPEVEYTEEQKARADKKARLLEINKEAAKFFFYQLRSPHGENGYNYLKKRELTDETMQKFGLGYAEKNGNNLIQYLINKGFPENLIIEAGLANHSERSGVNSLFWNRVMFPIQDANHRVIGFGGRVMGDGEPKYLNSPETPVFDKRRNLFGLNFARTARSGDMILCEGYMDVISMHQAGFTQAVASLGTAFTAEQAHILHRYTDTVLLAYDSDGAGVKAALRAIGLLRDEGMTGKVINMRPYKDPDEFMKNLGREAFEERIRDAENSFFFEIRMLETQFDTKDPEGKTKFHREIARKLCEFEEDVERDNYLQAVAEKYYIGVENLRKLVFNYATQTGAAKPLERPRNTNQAKATPEENGKKAQRLLLTWISDDADIYPKIKSYISLDDFTDELYKSVAGKLFESIERNEFSPAAIISSFQDEEGQAQAAELFNTNLPEEISGEDKEQAIHDIIMTVKKSSYEYYMSKTGTDINALMLAIERKKALETLQKTHISLT